MKHKMFSFIIIIFMLVYESLGDISCGDLPCNGNGDCMTTSNNNRTWYCECEAPFRGERCLDLDDCVSKSCSSENLVKNEYDELECLCPYAKYGENCEKKLICEDSNIVCDTRSMENCTFYMYEKCYCCYDSSCAPLYKNETCKSSTCFRLQDLYRNGLDGMADKAQNLVSLITDDISKYDYVPDRSLIIYYTALIIDAVAVRFKPGENRNQNITAYLDNFLGVINNILKQQTNDIVASQRKYDSSKKITINLEEYLKNFTLDGIVFKTSKTFLDVVLIDPVEEKYNGYARSLNGSSIVPILNFTDVDFSTIGSSVIVDRSAYYDYDVGSYPQISYIIYKIPTFFLGYNDNWNESICESQVTSDVVSVASNELIYGDGLVTSYFRSYMPISEKCKQSHLATYKCVFWDYDNRIWNETGCNYTLTGDNLHQCVCSHMTHFAVLVDFNKRSLGEDCKTCETILQYATYIGNSLSSLGLVLTIIVYLVQISTKSVKNEFQLMFANYIYMLITLCVTLLLLNIFYIVFSTLKWSNDIPSCMVIGVLLHYTLLVSFGWMFCLGIAQYFVYNKVFTTINQIYLKSAVISFGVPLVPLVIILSINWKLYLHPQKYCWTHGVTEICTVLIPIILAIISNITIFILILKNHCYCCLNKTKKVQINKIVHPHNTASNIYRKRQFTIFSTCFVNMGITWIFALFLIIPSDMYTKTVFAFLFCIFNSFQGFLIFIAYILLTNTKLISIEKIKKWYYDSTEGDIYHHHHHSSNQTATTTIRTSM